MPTPDNRLRLPTTVIDFDHDVGCTGQEHDLWPAAGAQPRYDWLRMWLIAAISNQSSYEEPSNFREGSMWFDLSTLTIKIQRLGVWSSLSTVIGLTEGDDSEEVTTLSEFYDETAVLLQSTAPEVTWSGNCTEDGVTTLVVPEVLRDSIDTTKSRPFVYINGLLEDPRDSDFFTEVNVKLLNGATLNTDDKYTVIIRNITPQLFHVPDVDLP